MPDKSLRKRTSRIKYPASGISQIRWATGAAANRRPGAQT